MGPLILIGVVILGFLAGGIWGAIGAFILTGIVALIIAAAIASPEKEKRIAWGDMPEQKEDVPPTKRITASEWWGGIKLALKWNVYILGLLILLVLVLFLVVFLVGNRPAATADSAPKITGETWALDEIGDPAFKEYMLTVLWPRCPFYKDSGAVYRDCLWKARDEAKGAYRGQDGVEIENYCQALGGHFEGLLAGEIAISCEAFRFSRGLVP